MKQLILTDISKERLEAKALDLLQGGMSVYKPMRCVWSWRYFSVAYRITLLDIGLVLMDGKVLIEN